MATFVVRVIAGRGGRLQGHIERVRTGEKVPFTSGEELLACLRELHATDGPLAIGEENATGTPSDEEEESLPPSRGRPAKRRRS